jgi:hypothetical protein
MSNDSPLAQYKTFYKERIEEHIDVVEIGTSVVTVINISAIALALHTILSSVLIGGGMIRKKAIGKEQIISQIGW